MGGGKTDIVSAWGVERRISVSIQGIRVGESPEGSQVGKKGTPSVWMRLVHDGMARGQAPTRWITIGIFKHAVQVNLGIIWPSTSESITRESKHNWTILENACNFVSWWIILMIFWTEVQKRVYCQCQKYFSPGGTFSGILTILNVLANFRINKKAFFDMNRNVWVWGIITSEKREEVLIDSNYQVCMRFSPGGPNIRHPPKIGQF